MRQRGGEAAGEACRPERVGRDRGEHAVAVADGVASRRAGPAAVSRGISPTLRMLPGDVVAALDDVPDVTAVGRLDHVAKEVAVARASAMSTPASPTRASERRDERRGRRPPRDMRQHHQCGDAEAGRDREDPADVGAEPAGADDEGGGEAGGDEDQRRSRRPLAPARGRPATSARTSSVEAISRSLSTP